MRLINADAIQYCNYDLDNYHSFRAVDEDEIAEMPTIDPEELRPKGEWIEREHKDERGNYNLFHCSRCDEPNARKKNYCPNCGAKMEGKRCD